MAEEGSGDIICFCGGFFFFWQLFLRKFRRNVAFEETLNDNGTVEAFIVVLFFYDTILYE